jgi:hypothetical protein
MINPILYKYFEEKDNRFLKEAFAFADDWFRFQESGKSKDPIAWQDMATGIRALNIAFFQDRVLSGELKLDATTRARLDRFTDRHAIRLQDANFVSMGNHGLFQVFGLNLLCTVTASRPACANGRMFARAKFEEIFRRQFTEEGVHREHSPDYHRFVLTTIDQLGGAKKFEMPQVEQTLNRAEKILPWLALPNGEFASIGDTSGATKAKIDQPQLQCLTSAECYAVGDFSRSGYTIVRSIPTLPIEQQSMLFMTGMAYSTGHKHADDLSFELFESGRRVLIDSGKYGYTSNDNPMRTYVLSATAHNTVSLKDLEITPADIRIGGSSLRAVVQQNGAFELGGEIDRPNLFQQRRRLFYHPGKYLVVHDLLSSEESRQYVSSLHFAPDLVVSINGREAMANLGDHRMVRAELLETDCKIEMARGQNSTLLGWSSKSYLEMEPTSTVRAVCPGNRRTITWVISLNPEGREAGIALRDRITSTSN